YMFSFSCIQRTDASDTEAAHEAMADERRVAHGLTHAGRVVDLRRQQHRPALLEAARDELVEMHVVAHPMALHYARTARDGDDVGRARGRRHLLARDLIDA